MRYQVFVIICAMKCGFGFHCAIHCDIRCVRSDYVESTRLGSQLGAMRPPHPSTHAVRTHTTENLGSRNARTPLCLGTYTGLKIRISSGRTPQFANLYLVTWEYEHFVGIRRMRITTDCPGSASQ